MNSTSRSTGGMRLVHDREVADDFFDLERLWLMVRRNLFLVGCCVAAAVVLGILYLRAAPPVFASQARVFLDESIGTVASELPTVGGSIQLDNQIASQIEVLRSNRLALRVVDALALTQDPVFLSPPPSPLASVLAPMRGAVALLRGSQEPGTGPADGEGVEAQATAGRSQDEALRELAATVVEQNIQVSRVERSSVIAITYQSHDPALSFRVVRAYADAFLGEQRRSLAEAGLQATGWMETRLAELAAQRREAALAVEEFRSRNNLSVARGELVSEQRLSDLTSQIALAQSEVAVSQARSEQVQSVLAAADRSEAAVSALSTSSEIDDAVVRDLQRRYVEMSGRITQITADFGDTHPQALQLQRERELVSAQLLGELNRLASRYATEYQVARSRLDVLEAAISQQTEQNAGAGGSLVQLRELEQQAETLNVVYSNFLARYEEAVQRQSFPLTNFRLISDPVIAERAVGPRFMRTMAVFAFLGMVVGAGLGTLREFNERGYRTGSALSQDLGVRFIGYVATVPRGHGGRADLLSTRRSNAAAAKAPPGAAPRRDKPSRGRSLRTALQGLLGRGRTAKGGAGAPTPDGDIARTISIETLRNAVHLISNRVDARPRGRVVGIVSALPEEGKTTIAVGLSRLLALSGQRVLLVDADLRKPAVGRHLPSFPETGGLADAIRGGDWRAGLVRDEAGVDILTTPDDCDAEVASTLLASDAAGKLVEALAAQYDYVVLDLPPAGLVVDAKALAHLTDGLLLVVRWGKTARVILRTFLGEEPEIAARLTGAVLNGTELAKLRRYGERGSREQVYQRYGGYYRGA